jgi:hypothetical protein
MEIFVAVGEVFSKSHSGKYVPSNTTVPLLVTEFRDTSVAVSDIVLVGNPKGKSSLRSLDVGWRIILKWASKK